MASLGIKGTDAFNLNRPNYFLSMRPKSPTVLNMAVWSNGQAVKGVYIILSYLLQCIFIQPCCNKSLLSVFRRRIFLHLIPFIKNTRISL